jgi:ribosomal protein S18 acetylase RimI-like enzyme
MIRIEPLAPERVDDGASILREYMIATELEGGNQAALVAGLPDLLERECHSVLEVYMEPNRLFLAYDSEVLAGCVAVKVRGTDAEIKRLFVRMAHRRKRIASGLMEAAEGHARSIDAERLVLDVLPSRTRVIEWYRRAGFREAPPFIDATISMVYLQKVL